MLISIKLSLLSALTFVSLFKLVCLYNNNYSFVNLICLQPLCKSNLYFILLIRVFVILLPTFFFKQATYPNRRLTELLSTSDSFVLPFYSPARYSNERSGIISFLFSPVRELYRNRPVIFAFAYLSSPHAYCYWFKCSMYLLVWICVHMAVRLCCVCAIHPFHTHSDVIVGLLISSSVAFVLFFSYERYISRCLK